MPRRKRRTLDYGSPTVEHLLSYDEAVKLVKSKRNVFYYLMVGTWCPFKVNDLHGSVSTSGYVAAKAVKVTRSVAINFMAEAFAEHVRSKININVITADGFIWIGRAP
jgi:hypothetical protein